MAYEFLHHNMPQALPSLRTIQQLVQSQYSHIEEGVFRFDHLLQYHNAPLIVVVAEDTTRIS